MVEETDGTDGPTAALEAGRLRDAREATLGGCPGHLSRSGNGWTWRGRLPQRVLAALLGGAVTGAEVSLLGPPGTPERVSLRELTFDAESGLAACELSSDEAVRSVS